jgi:hypothetical protein
LLAILAWFTSDWFFAGEKSIAGKKFPCSPMIDLYGEKKNTDFFYKRSRGKTKVKWLSLVYLSSKGFFFAGKATSEPLAKNKKNHQQ